jgi:hypothetical protein
MKEYISIQLTFSFIKRDIDEWIQKKFSPFTIFQGLFGEPVPPVVDKEHVFTFKPGAVNELYLIWGVPVLIEKLYDQEKDLEVHSSQSLTHLDSRRERETKRDNHSSRLYPFTSQTRRH